MKLDMLIGTLLLGSVIACSASEEKAADAQQPVTVPERTTGTNEPAANPTVGGSSTTITPGAAAAPAAPAEPAAPVPETCESLAAKAATPAGKLTDLAAEGMYPIAPIDVYATETEAGLSIILTETANACAYHANHLKASKVNELTFLFPKGDKAFGVGTFGVAEFSQEAGTVCATEATDFSIGSAWGGGSARGQLTITNKTATLIEGTITITDGPQSTFSFRAPICAGLPADAEATCCASPAP